MQGAYTTEQYPSVPPPNTARSLQTLPTSADELTSKEKEKPALLLTILPDRNKKILKIIKVFKWLSGSEGQHRASMSLEPQT